MTLRPRRVPCLAFVLLLSSCGGSSATGAGPKTSSAHGESRADRASEESEDTEDTGPPPSPCADGSCVECGAGICPKGFYCDESAPGGAACGWLPDCAKDPTCSCVKAGLGSSCDCEDKNGAPFVKCQ